MIESNNVTAQMRYYLSVVKTSGCREVWHQWKWREKKCSFGKENPDKIFYVIRWDQETSGIMGLLCHVLANIRYAETKGYIPVVDFKNGRNLYFPSNDDVGKYNVWEKFFEQITPYTLDEVYQSKTVVLGSVVSKPDRPSPELLNSYDGSECAGWRALCRKYIHPAPIVCSILQELIKRFGNPSAESYAIKLRGTDYVPPPSGHYFQPDLDTVIQSIENEQKRLILSRLYLATEDKSIASALEQVFSKNIVVVTTDFLKPKNGLLASETNDDISVGQQYLAELLFLSRCPRLLGGLNGGLLGIVLLAEHLPVLTTWNLGRAL